MRSLDLLDETLDIFLTTNYHLSIEASTDGFSFCILDTQKNKYIALKHFDFDKNVSEDEYDDEFKEILKTEELLNKNYKSVGVINNSSKSVLVPAPLFDKNNLKTYFTFNHYLNGAEIIDFNKLKNIDAFNIFTLPSGLAALLINKFPDIKFYHQSTPFIENFLINYKNKVEQNKCVGVNIHKEFFDILVISPENLILYNTFSFRNEDDFIYFIMYIYEQLKLNPELSEIILSGDITEDSAYYQTIKKFIKNVKFDKLSDNFTYSYIFNEIPSHFFVNLLNLCICE